MNASSGSNESVEEFGQQLRETEAQLGQLSREYPELSPDQQRECLERLEKTMATLQKIRGELVEAQKRDAFSSKMVQVTGFESSITEKLNVHHFQTAFENEIQSRFCRRPDLIRVEIQKIPTDFSLVFEDNYVSQVTGKFIKVKEMFVEFRHDSDIKYVLDKKDLLMLCDCGPGLCGVRLNFIQPNLDMDRRKTFREIGGLVDRLNAIEAEYTVIGAVRGAHSKPELGPGFVDRSWVEAQMPSWKRACNNGLSMDSQHFTYLRHVKIVNTRELTMRLEALHKEEKKIILTLIEFKLNGFEFDF